jgi:hypothetical protein
MAWSDDKLNIQNEMAKFDLKDRDFFDSLNEEETKKFSPFLMIRWGAGVEGSQDLQAYYLVSTNEKLNTNFFDINTAKHKKFQWLLATTVSPDIGKQYHKWLSAPKKAGGSNKTEKFLAELNPMLSIAEVKLLAKLHSKDDLKVLAKSHGLSDKEIKDIL